MENAFEWVPIEFEDIQAIAFYAWLKARLTNKNNYKTLLDFARV